MGRLTIWNSGRRSSDYKFFDRTISNFFSHGGTSALIHLYLGVHEQGTPTHNLDGTTSPAADPANPTADTPANVTGIQDVLFLENRDRKYSTEVYELPCIYNVGDSDFDLRQFGLFLTNDTYFIEFHFNDMIAVLGRKIMPGDVLELPHQRDEFLLNDGPATNKFYLVEDANRASDGYSATWFSHIWRVKVSPMPASQEYQDILNQQQTNPLGLPATNADGTPTTLNGALSSVAVDLGLNEAVVNAARDQLIRRNFETQQFWFLPGTTDEAGAENPWVYAGDGIPPNGAVPLGQGTSFPTGAAQGAYFLRTDYVPAALYMLDGGRWRRQEINWRNTWSMAHRILESFVNDRAVVTQEDGNEVPEKVNLSKTVTRPGVDF